MTVTGKTHPFIHRSVETNVTAPNPLNFISKPIQIGLLLMSAKKKLCDIFRHYISSYCINLKSLLVHVLIKFTY